MLEQVLDHIHNYFERNIVKGTFAISDGSLDVDFLQDNQYFRVVGSIFNDGVHRYPDDTLVDESFTGEIWALAVPASVVELASEIGEWESENSHSPFVSESFGGYSYSKGTNSKTGGSVTWQDEFRGSLNHWRKII